MSEREISGLSQHELWGEGEHGACRIAYQRDLQGLRDEVERLRGLTEGDPTSIYAEAAVTRAKVAMYENWLREHHPDCPLLAENIVADAPCGQPPPGTHVNPAEFGSRDGSDA